MLVEVSTVVEVSPRLRGGGVSPRRWRGSLSFFPPLFSQLSDQQVGIRGGREAQRVRVRIPAVAGSPCGVKDQGESALCPFCFVKTLRWSYWCGLKYEARYAVALAIFTFNNQERIFDAKKTN